MLKIRIFLSFKSLPPKLAFFLIKRVTNLSFKKKKIKNSTISFLIHRSFRFRVDEYDLCVYGVLDGFGGADVADFVQKRIPAELLWGQIQGDKSGKARQGNWTVRLYSNSATTRSTLSQRWEYIKENKKVRNHATP